MSGPARALTADEVCVLRRLDEAGNGYTPLDEGEAGTAAALAMRGFVLTRTGKADPEDAAAPVTEGVITRAGRTALFLHITRHHAHRIKAR